MSLKLYCREYPYSLSTPLKAYQALAHPYDNSCLLEVEGISFLGFNPVINSCFPSIEEIFQSDERFPPCFGGVVGLINYDAVRQFENVPDRHPQGQMADLQFFSYRTQLLFDHRQQRLLIACEDEAFEVVVKKIQKNLSSSKIPVEHFDFQPELSDGQFQQLVLRAKQYLRKGDIFQVVLSRTFSKPSSVNPIALYKVLTKAPYRFLFNLQQGVIVGASPEKLVSVLDGKLETVPIAGTSLPFPKAESELLLDPKENAEHMMLVDLARNDLGRIAVPGSVKVEKLRILQRHSHVSHLVSIVQAVLKQGLQPSDIIRAVFPAGTLSGAPKIRAMEIIDELEVSRRGLYGGAICFFDHRGNMDSCLAIRTAILKDGKIYVRAGAGIVLDSDPYKEAMETRHKAAAIFESIRIAEGECHACNHR